jgi:predicted RNA-binding protein with PUA-like domain
MAATSVGKYALFAGGNGNGSLWNTVDIFNSVTGQWSTATLSQARENVTATSVGDYALFAGGMSNSTVSDTVDMFNSVTGLWSTATLSQARYLMAATSVGDHALFGGGYMDTVDIFTTPEPATLALMSLGGLALLRRRRAARA